MTPSARVQAAIELLDAIIIAARDGGASADVLTARFLKERRYMGSKDRRAVRDLVYDAIRLIGERPENGRAAMAMLAVERDELQPLFDGSRYGPEPLSDTELSAKTGEPVPNWIEKLLPDFMGADEIAALLERAPLDLRVTPGARDAVVTAFPEAEFSDHLAHAARLSAGTQVQNSTAWRDGLIDIQDWGSQAICELCDASQQQRIIDLCAGAGGKTLALAQQATPDTAILATDTSRVRLAELPPRAKRLNITNIQTRLLNPGQESAMLADCAGQADCVLVDAPCSGTGVWRRNPEARWRLDSKRLERLCATQSRLLDIAANLVRPGGILVYAVCSILPKEGAEQIASLIKRNPQLSLSLSEFPLGRYADTDGVQLCESALGLVLTPLHDATDGFFLTRLVKS